MKELKIKLSWFKPGMRVYDAIYMQVAIVVDVDAWAVHVAFPTNITNHGGILNYAFQYEKQYFTTNSRLMIVDDNGNIKTLEEFFENQL